MNGPLFLHTWRANRGRLAIVALALFVWGALLPIIYDAFGAQFQQLQDSGLIPTQFTQFGGGDIFSLTGSVALGFIHPLAVGLMLVFAVGFAASAVAGERQRGTLEVLLSRPISRRRVYLTLLAAVTLFVAVVVAALTLGAFTGAALTDRVAELGSGNLPVLWLNSALLFVSIASVSLAASVSFDRLGPAIGVALAFVLVQYFMNALGELWPDADWLQPFSVFSYLDARAALTGLPDPANFMILAGVIAVAVVYALVVFPRRDLSAPS